LFVYNFNKSYYINEAAKLVKTSAGTAQRELERLVKSGFLTKEKKANLTYFKINAANPLLSDIKSIVNKTIGLEIILKEKLSGIKNINFAFLFGSYARGDFKSDSDIDLYIIGEIREDNLYKEIRKIEEKIRREINYHLSTPEEFKKKSKHSFFYKEILSKYILIIGDEDEFRKFIK
jgi:predicted nucleotidyltransferase